MTDVKTAVLTRKSPLEKFTSFCGSAAAWLVTLVLFGLAAASLIARMDLLDVSTLAEGKALRMGISLPELLAYQSALIFILAVCIVAAFSGFGHGSKQLLGGLVLAALLLAVPVAAENIGQTVFFNRAPIPYSSGMPASATVLMGIHSGTYYGPGGYDASSWKLFWANNYDTNATNAAAVKGIREYIATYLHNPKEVKFFLQKTAWQWLDPWFEALTMNGPSITVAGGAGWLATALAGGVLFTPVQALLRALLTFVYLFAGIGTLELRRKTDGSVWAQLLGITFFGGFLFQLVWETKSRYCFPFFVFLLPLAALGFTAALRRAGERLAK